MTGPVYTCAGCGSTLANHWDCPNCDPAEPPVGAVAVIRLNNGDYASARRIAEAYEDAENHGWVFTGSHYAHPWAHVIASGELITIYTPEAQS